MRQVLAGPGAGVPSPDLLATVTHREAKPAVTLRVSLCLWSSWQPCSSSWAVKLGHTCLAPTIALLGQQDHPQSKG